MVGLCCVHLQWYYLVSDHMVATDVACWVQS